jgi:hypothetical protein
MRLMDTKGRRISHRFKKYIYVHGEKGTIESKCYFKMTGRFHEKVKKVQKSQDYLKLLFGALLTKASLYTVFEIYVKFCLF